MKFKRLFAIALILAASILAPQSAKAGAVATTQVTTLAYDTSGGEAWELLRVNNVTSADTIDVSAAGMGTITFTQVKSAAFVVMGSRYAGFGLSTSAALCTYGAGAGTPGTDCNLTMTLTSMSHDTIILFIVGQR